MSIVISCVAVFNTPVLTKGVEHIHAAGNYVVYEFYIFAKMVRIKSVEFKGEQEYAQVWGQG